MEDDPTFGPDFARRLERLKWVLRKRIAGSGEGERAGRRKGGLIEFAEHRDYAPGDDLRYVDWNVYLRLGKLAVKEFAKEEEVPLVLLLDVSASMGAGDGRKFRLALESAAALGFIALASRNPVSVLCFREGERNRSRVFRGEDALRELMAFIEPQTPLGATDLAGSLRAARASTASNALSVLVSDMMDEDGFLKELSTLSTRGRDVCILQILSSSEVAPSIEGKVALIDAETGERLDLDLAEEDLRAYREGHEARVLALRRFAGARGIRFVAVRSDTPFEEVVLKTLREANWLRFRG